MAELGNTPRSELLDLKQLGARLQKLDPLILRLIGLRMDLTDQVGAFKRTEEDPEKRKIFRPTVEDERISDMQALAGGLGLDPALNPHFIEILFYSIINESCKRQMILFQREEERLANVPPDEDVFARLKSNLLVLARGWSTNYDDEYERHAFATRAYLEFEHMLIEQEVGQLADHGAVVDIGCATGRVALSFANTFDRVYGLDLSPDMVRVAEANAERQGLSERATFLNADVETGIPLPDASVSFVVMNFGTASDVRGMQSVLGEILRILKPGGRFFLSFYNSEALVYQWEFIPWPVGLAALINKHRKCLDVQSTSGKISVYAESYTTASVQELIRSAGVEAVTATYPAVSALLPNDLFEGQSVVQQAIAALDRTLASSTMGAYIIATGAKP